ncbi:MAG: YmdB family metallophosphoesterase [Nitrospira sp.]
MKVLCIGDVMGEPGRRTLARMVPRLVAQRQVDAVIANGENVAGGDSASRRSWPRNCLKPVCQSLRPAIMRGIKRSGRVFFP